MSLRSGQSCVLLYKCRLCNELFDHSTTRYSPEKLDGVFQGQNELNSAHHQCSDIMIGVGDFVGIRLVPA